MALNSTREKLLTYTPSKGILSRIGLMPAPTMPHDPPPAYDAQPRNVVIFGETGTGKSSVVNLLAGRKLAPTSPDAGACTFASNPYHVVLQNNRPFCIWDTIGLNEPEIAGTEYLRAIKHAYTLIKELERSGGAHLLLLCMRGRLTKSVEQNYRLFVKIFCEQKVPLGVVVTNLENEQSMEQWWTKNEKVFKESGIYADGHACITASPGVNDIFMNKYEESGERMRKLLLDLTLSTCGGWKKETRRWLVDLLGKMAKMLPPQRGRSSHNPIRKGLVTKLVKECGFSRKDANSIATSIMEVVGDQTPGSD